MASYVSYRSLAAVACVVGALLSTQVSAKPAPVPARLRASAASAKNPDAFCVKTMCIAGAVVDGDIHYTLTSSGSLPVGWMAIGFGHSMADSEMVVMWPNADGSHTLSQRRAPYETEPRPDGAPHAQAELLTESSFTDATDDSLVTVSFALPMSDAQRTAANMGKYAHEDIIWAYSIKHPEPEPDAHIGFHDRWGHGKLAISHESSGSNTNTPPTTAIESDTATSSNSVETKQLSSTRAIVVHGVLCMVALLVFLPAAAVLARWRAEWTTAYAWLQLGGAGGVLMSGLVTAAFARNGAHLDDAHARVGALLVLLFIMQSALGMYVSRALRLVPGANMVATVVGLSVLAVALYQTYTGLAWEWAAATGAGRPIGFEAVWWAALFVSPSVYVGSLFLGRTREYYIALYSPPLPKDGEVEHEMEGQYEIGHDDEEDEEEMGPEETRRMLSKAQ